jgi:hypothetical protein
VGVSAVGVNLSHHVINFYGAYNQGHLTYNLIGQRLQGARPGLAVCRWRSALAKE